MNRNAEARIERLERRLVPCDPFNWEDYLIDEVLALKLEEYAQTLAHGARFTAAGEDAKKGRVAIIADHFAFNVDLRSGKRPYPVENDTYQAAVARAAKCWTARGGKTDYVPAVNHWWGNSDTGEYDGFIDGGLFFEDLMERRARLWRHPLVIELFGDASHRA